MEEFQQGDLVWFDPGFGYVIPGEVVEFHRAGQVISIQALIGGKSQVFTMNNIASVKRRQDLGALGLEDMIQLGDLNEASLLWNLRMRYDKQHIYTYTGSILVAVNPYKMFDIYGLDMVKKYEGQILGILPPHLFAIGSSAYSRMSKDNENQVVVISGESGAGKTESTKLIMQYLAAVNKSTSNLITEQILEASPLLEAFGNAKTVRNDNSSRFGKYLEVHFKGGVITGANTTEYLLEKSRIVTQAPEERNYHVFYEILAGLNDEQKEKYGLLTADKYFYLNQGGSCEISCKDDGDDFEALLSAMQVLGFTSDEQETIFKILAAVLHLGNIYFHRKPLKHGQEGVEIGSDAEVKWASHLLQLSVEGIAQALTTKTTEARNERLFTPLNIDQALDARDAIAKALYSSLFSWLVQRINSIVCKGAKKTSIAILDIFGFEDFKENSFEQLCINYANETLQFYFNKHIFKLEQQEYAKEKIDWQIISFQDNQPVINLISKKPVGLLHLLDDESNFPKATDVSFLEKCHYNHALNELYSRPRMSSMEFGVTHYAGQVWYSVEGFLDKNRDTLRSDVIELLISSKVPLISKMFMDLRNMSEAAKTISRSNGRFVTMKPRTPTVAARFHDSLLALVENMGRCNPWFVRCIKPNNEKAAMNFDMAIVLEQLRYTGMLETIKIRKMGYPMRLKFQVFADRYRCLVPGRVPKGVPAREICRVILDRVAKNREQFQLGTSKVFLRESMEQLLEQKRYAILNQAAIAIQKHLRGRVARKRFLTMRRSAVKIQSQVRGHLARKNYEKVRRGIVRAQATYRMSRQKRRFAELKDEIRRREVAEKEDRERAKVKAQKVEQEKMSRATAAGVNHLEIPAELAFIFSKLDDWQPQHGERNIIKVVGNVPTVEERYRLPSDIDYYAFSKFINVYFKSHTWGMRRDPIKTPFLAKLKDSDYHESLAVFKLILRFMNDNNLTGRKETVLGDYIVQKGLVNESMRDEILCQLCNQTWKNDSESATERGWLLMANCLSCFPPSKTLYKYLLKYVSDNAYNGYKATCQKKLLQSERIDPFLVRTYPPCMLEWKSNRKHCNMALEVAFPDGQVMYGPVESWTVGEQFAAALVKERRISECWGWTVSLHTFNDTSELNGYDYVLDLISSVEVPPAFPICKISFLSSHEKDKEQKVEKRKTVSPVAANAEVMKALEVDVIFAPPIEPVRKPGHMYRSRSHEMILEDSRSHTRGGDREGFENALSRSSMLNERYFDASIDERNRSGSLERLGLSRSRLNERYRSMENLTEQQMVNQNFFVQADVTSRDLPRSSESTLEGNNQGGEKDRWGLSPSSLNGRYFHQAEMEKQQASATRTRTEESVRHSQNDFHSSQNDFHDNKLHVNGHSNDLESSPSPDLHGSNGIVDFSEFDFQDLNGDRDTDQDTSKYSRVSSSRFVKSNNKKMQSSSHSHSTKGYLETKFPDKDYAPRSSAMSDTSEAPSLASHVRQVRVPSHTSDLDQYLDDLFNPVLDGNLDELSDARSLAASIKGGGDQPQEHCRIKRNSPVLPITEDTFYSSEHQSSGVDDFINDLFSPIFLHHSVDTLGNAEHLSRSLKGGGAGIGGMEAQGSTATQNAPMLNMMLGGLQSPLTGMMSPPPVLGTGMPTTSVPTMMTGLSMMPPMNSTLPLYSLGGLSDSASGSTPLMYAYVPLYNASGFSLPMWNPTSGMVDPSQLAMQHQLLQQQQQAMQINATQVQHMQQRAFLASAVQQNLQMQQQLMQQNQALQQLLQQNALGQSPPQASSVNATPSAGNSFHTSADVSRSTSAAGATSQTSMTNLLRQRLIDSEDSRTQKVGFREPEHSLWSEDKRKWTTSPPPPLPPKSGSDNSTPSPPNKSVHRNSPPQKQNWAHAKQASFGEVISELRNRRSSVESNGVVSSPGKAGAPKFVPSGNIPPPPPLPPELPETSHPFVNVYGRAKTVRIGKWRWPPPRSDGNDPDNYFEFKLKQHHKRGDDDRVGRQDRLSSSSDEKPEFFPEKEKRDFKLDSPPHDSFDNSPARNGRPSNKSFESNEPRPSPGSVGKLKISSEMRAKLEAVTANHSVRSTSNKSDARRVYAAVNKLKAQARDDPSHSVRKLEENRKLALQRQLGGMYGSSDFGDDRVSDVNESIVDRMEKDSRSSVFNRLSAPPPPPVAPPSFTIPPPPPSTIGDASSYYDPGGPVIPEPKSPPAPVSPSSRIYSHHQHHNRQNRLERIQHIERSSNFTERTSNYTERKSNFAERNSNFAERNSNFAERNSNFAERTPNYSERALNYAERTPNYAERTPNYAERTPNYAERTSNYTERTHHDEGYSRSAELANITDEADSRQLENMKTKLYPQNKLPYNTYTRTPWNLHIRKEVFTPSEQLTNPLALHIIFCQVVQDAFSPSCIRMTKEECKKLRQMLDGYGITPNNMQSPHHKTTIKKNVVDIARDYPTYFSRLFPVSGGRTLPEVQMLGVSHSGVRLIRREKDSASDWLRVLEEYSFEDVAEVSIPRGSTLQLLLRTGHRVVLFTHRALQIRNLIDQFALEADSGAHEYVRAVADYVTRESTLLSFRQGDIIRVVNKNQYLDKGWLYGILDGRTGIFPCEYVVPLGRNEVASFTKEENIHKSSKSVQHAIHTETHHESHTVHRDAVDSAVWADNRTQPAHDYPDDKSDISYLTQVNDGKHSLLQFALLNFRQSLDKYEMLRTADGSIRGSLKMIESLKSKKKGKKGKDSDWTWKEQVEMVKYTKSPIQASLLRLESTELNKLALECFIAIMRYMGDYPMAKNQTDVDCVYTILMNCHRHPQLRDEVYCQIMKQTTNNKSPKADSCQKGWRLFSIIAAYFDCSDLLKPYLFKYLETAAYDKRRAYHGTAMVCLQNLRKTFKFGGRKNVPSIEEITAITAGRNSKRQIYRLPGGTERVINTKSTSVVADIIEEICTHLNIRSLQEMEEFSLYCIVEGDTFTMPLAREEYILDVTTELHKNQQVFYLIFCRSVWYYPLRLDSQLYIEVVFNQIAPDYLEGLLLIMPGETIPSDVTYDIAKVAALLHRAAQMENLPSIKETKYLLPKPALNVRDIKPPQWVNMVQNSWRDVEMISPTDAKVHILEILQKWPLFGSSFYAVKKLGDARERTDFILAINRNGVDFLDIVTHETLYHYPFSEVISTRKVKAEDGALFLDMKVGNLMVQKITRIQTEQAHEISRLIKQYIMTEQRNRGVVQGETPTREVTIRR